MGMWGEPVGPRQEYMRKILPELTCLFLKSCSLTYLWSSVPQKGGPPRGFLSTRRGGMSLCLHHSIGALHVTAS